MNRCRWSLVAVALAGALQAGEPPPNQLTPEEAAAGWKLLFDGKTTDGWRNYKGKGVNPGWQVVDGALVRKADAKEAGDLVSLEEYDFFELSLDYKISKGGNSGLMYHVKETAPAPWMTGPEVQILDNVDGKDPQKSGWLYQLHKSKLDATKPVGEWNTLRIVIKHDQCQHFMNGKKYCEYVLHDTDWDTRVAKSKFAKYPEFGKAKKGHFCLQDHGDEVAFRNIKYLYVKAVFD